MNNYYVQDLMTSPAITCDFKTPIKEAISILKSNNIGFLPITKENILVGVVTDRDILIRGVSIFKLNTRIEKVMTTGDIKFVGPKDSLKHAAKIMAESKVRRLVVLDDGKITGVITTKKLLVEPSLFPLITQTYLPNATLKGYEIYNNSNPHDSIKVDDYPL